MFVYNILIMETPIKINIDNNSYYSNKKEIEHKEIWHSIQNSF